MYSEDWSRNSVVCNKFKRFWHRTHSISREIHEFIYGKIIFMTDPAGMRVPCLKTDSNGDLLGRSIPTVLFCEPIWCLVGTELSRCLDIFTPHSRIDQHPAKWDCSVTAVPINS